ncbi:MAG: ParB/Srx family N-terminal domain-containing protein [Clostridium sp.]|nr:ParB/Srx family N-terminal domain-containing protein [Clostridium sp.]
MKLETVNISELKPLERNVRKHGENQINELAKSVSQFGITRAMVIDDDNNILIGNGLYFALQKLGMDSVECYRMTGLTETQKKKLILSDNKVYSLGADDYSEIENYIKEIVSDDDYDIPGFDEDVLRQLTATVEELEQSVADYGTITDEAITSPEPPAMKAQNSIASVSEETGNSTEEMPPETHHAAEDNRHKIICPNCGEVIYID